MAPDEPTLKLIKRGLAGYSGGLCADHRLWLPKCFPVPAQRRLSKLDRTPRSGERPDALAGWRRFLAAAAAAAVAEGEGFPAEAAVSAAEVPAAVGERAIMRHRKFISQLAHEQIHAAIHAAEEKSSGEIRIMVSHPGCAQPRDDRPGSLPATRHAGNKAPQCRAHIRGTAIPHIRHHRR